jgi:hypothetical protein
MDDLILPWSLYVNYITTLVFFLGGGWGQQHSQPPSLSPRLCSSDYVSAGWVPQDGQNHTKKVAKLTLRQFHINLPNICNKSLPARVRGV